MAVLEIPTVEDLERERTNALNLAQQASGPVVLDNADGSTTDTGLLSAKAYRDEAAALLADADATTAALAAADLDRLDAFALRLPAQLHSFIGWRGWDSAGVVSEDPHYRTYARVGTTSLGLTTGSGGEVADVAYADFAAAGASAGNLLRGPGTTPKIEGAFTVYCLAYFTPSGGLVTIPYASYGNGNSTRTFAFTVATNGRLTFLVGDGSNTPIQAATTGTHQTTAGWRLLVGKFTPSTDGVTSNGAVYVRIVDSVGDHTATTATTLQASNPGTGGLLAMPITVGHRYDTWNGSSGTFPAAGQGANRVMRAQLLGFGFTSTLETELVTLASAVLGL